MTNAEKIDAFDMRLNGSTWREIGDKHNITGEAVRKVLERAMRHKNRKYRSIAYPNVGMWMKENNMSLKRLSEKVGVSYCTIRYIINGKGFASKEVINKLLKVTGMTFEQFFWEGNLDDTGN